MNNLRSVDLNLLVILDALLIERHLSRAALRLHMSQPAVSHALGRLRTLLDDPLLVRGAGGFQPTTRALELSAPLAEALRQVHAVLGPAGFTPSQSQRTFRVAMSDYGAAVVLPPLLRRLRADAPGVAVTVLSASRAGMAAWVADGDADLALGVFPQVPDGVMRETLFEERYACAVDAASLPDGGCLTLADYLARPHVLVAAGDDRIANDVDALLAGRGTPRRVVLRLPHWSVAPTVLTGTDMILTLARRALRPPRLAGLRVVKPPFDIAPFAFEQIWPGRMAGDAGLNWLRRAIRDAVDEDPTG